MPGSNGVRLLGRLSETYSYEELSGRYHMVNYAMMILKRGFMTEEGYAEAGQRVGIHTELFGVRTLESDTQNIKEKLDFMQRHIDNGAITDQGVINEFNELKQKYSEL